MTARKRRPYVETEDFAGMVERMVRALARRVGESGDIDNFAQLGRIVTLTDQLATEAAQMLHDEGYSWTEIGDRLGVSRQAARQRFARPTAVRASSL